MVSRIRPSSRVPRAAFVLAAALVGVVPFVEAGKPLPEVPLVVSFGAAPGMMILSEATPPDTAAYTDGVDNVRAFLFPSGNLSFTTRANTALTATRTVYFGEGIPAEYEDYVFPDPLFSFPDGYSTLEAQVMVGPFFNPDAAVNIQTLGLNQSVRRLTRFNWKVGTDTYRLGYGTDMDGNDVEDSPPVVVTCTFAVANKCTTWTVAPEGDGTAALFVAHQVPGKGGKLTTGPNEYVGHYVMPFVQTLTVK